jgi:GR25 family glycosyltransferase involved in LPS biosynthesis
MGNSLEVKIINLERATARREAIRQMFGGSSLDWSFFSAHTSLDTTEISYSEAGISRTFGRALSTPEQAVWSSHYFAIKTFLEHSERDYLLVFEDDVIFDVALPVGQLTDYMAQNNIHYLRLFGMYNAAAVRIAAWYDRSILRYKSSPAGAQAYLLSKEGAARMVASLKTINATIDLAMDEFWNTGLPIYALFPFPVIERFSPTSIPMRPETPLSASEKTAVRNYRVSQKLKKIRQNMALSSSDKQLQAQAGHFQQIHSQDIPGA